MFQVRGFVCVCERERERWEEATQLRLGDNDTVEVIDAENY